MKLRRGAVPVLLTAILAATFVACTGGGGDEDPLPTTPTTAVNFSQRRFYDAFAIPLFTNFGTSLTSGYELDKDSIQVVDVAVKDLEYSSDTERERFEFAKSQGLLGFYRGDFTKPEGEDFWGLTTLVFKKPAGAKAMWDRYGNYESVTITGSKLARSQESEIGAGRTGRLFVDVYRNEDRTVTLALRGSLLDQNAVHHVIATLDVGGSAEYDAFGALRTLLGSVEGTMREAYQEARKNKLIDKRGRIKG